jgi:DnaJ homolog subfamily C member 28
LRLLLLKEFAMDKWEPLVDRLIRESMERGEFDNLSGTGQPIDLSENPFEDPDTRTAHRLLRNAGFAPAWIEERKDIDAEFQQSRTTLIRAKEIYGRDGKLSQSAQWQRAVNEFRVKTRELNRRIKHYNLKSPAVAFHKNLIDAEQLIKELEDS